MYYSYLMGGNDKILELKKYGFIINKNNEEDYEITFPIDMERKYERYILDNLQPGFWNEWLNEEKVYFLFRFKNGDFRGYELNDRTESEILKLCCEFANTNFTSVKEMIMDNDFYSKNLKV